jgi:hypothetical protein
MEQRSKLVLHCAEQLHVHVLPDSCAIEIESTPSAVGTLVGAAVGGAGTYHMNTHRQSTQYRLRLNAHTWVII